MLAASPFMAPAKSVIEDSSSHWKVHRPSSPAIRSIDDSVRASNTTIRSPATSWEPCSRVRRKAPFWAATTTKHGALPATCATSRTRRPGGKTMLQTRMSL